MLKNQFHPISKKLAPTFMAVGLSSMLLTGCAGIQVTSPLPSIKSAKSVDPRDCHEDKGFKFDGGWFIPASLTLANSTKFNKACQETKLADDRANVVTILLTSTSPRELNIALDIYDNKIGAEQRKRVDTFLAENKTDITKIRERLPKLIAQTAQDGCRISTMTLPANGKPVQVYQCNPTVVSGLDNTPKP